MLTVTIKCNKCGTEDTVEVPDSIPYCPKCGKPITPDEIQPERNGRVSVIGKPVDLAKESGCTCENCGNPVDPMKCADGYTPCCNELIKWPT